MERSLQDQMQAHLTATSEEYRRLANAHADYARRPDQLAARPYLTEQEKIEEVRLKKLKLRLKDEMQHMVQQSASREVA